jgi:transcriptional regulator with XRE-family HTH domain
MSTILTPQLCKAARILLKWSQEDLSRNAEVGLRSITRFESETESVTPIVTTKLYEAFKAGGIQFIASNTTSAEIDGLGLRFAPSKPDVGIKIL